MRDTLNADGSESRSRSESRRRKRDIHVRADDQEYDDIARFAKSEGVSMGAYLRTSGLKRGFSKRAPQAHVDAVWRLGSVVEKLVALNRELLEERHKVAINDVLTSIRLASDALVDDVL